MAFFLTPRFVPLAAPSCSPFGCAPASRAVYRQPAPRPVVPSFVPFLSQIDDLFSEIDREARRAAHHARQQRKRVFRARFDVNENKDGYQVEGEVPGFEQENIDIEVTDAHTLSIKANTEHKAEQPAAAVTETTTQVTQSELDKTTEEMDGVTITDAEVQGARAATPSSETGSHKSYQPTVEDDFEDLGAETSSTLSAASNEPRDPKGKEKAVEEPTVAAAEPVQPQQPAQPESNKQNERPHVSFERTFRFPVRIDAANVKAALRNGVLSIEVPKAPLPEVRRIAIR
ncbi:HSP20-like chaperone [Clohesyomyces aquaticus]|uniref:HSP20-like chaperone n=1 Tax=Clohesyomyces aquaticus TaxID=1231657 RepID=A0A1Y1YQ53_9PLEO|nr:HSP20-like chaperone [Clohesyomyces aquaticus]